MGALLTLFGLLVGIVLGGIGLNRIYDHRDSWIRLASGALLAAWALVIFAGMP